MCWAGLISKKQTIDLKTGCKNLKRKTRGEPKNRGGRNPQAGNQLFTGKSRSPRTAPPASYTLPIRPPILLDVLLDVLFVLSDVLLDVLVDVLLDVRLEFLLDVLLDLPLDVL